MGVKKPNKGNTKGDDHEPPTNCQSEWKRTPQELDQRSKKSPPGQSDPQRPWSKGYLPEIGEETPSTSVSSVGKDRSRINSPKKVW
jgi:hypothetical protein